MPYQEGKKWLVRFLSDDVRDRTILASAISYFDHLIGDSSTPPSKVEDARRSKAAIDAFFEAYNELELGRLTFRPAPKLQPLMINGVRVSASIDLLTSTTLKGADYQGGVILRLTLPEENDSAKSKRSDMGGYTATLAHMQIEDKRPGVGAPLAKICLAIDVQHKAKYEARAGSSRRRSNIEAACTMIKSIWPAV
jgi:hypothetical protein